MVVGRTYRKPALLGMVTAGATGIAIAVAVLTPSRDSMAQGEGFLRNREAGFVLTHFAYALGPDASQTGACPAGMSSNLAEIFGASPEGKRRPGEGDGDYGKRIEAGGERLGSALDGRNYCMHPQIAPPDTHFRTIERAGTPADGIDLDGKTSRGDFTRKDGLRGVDNQFFRAVGCLRSFQSAGQSNAFETEMYSGSWGILVHLREVDDIVDDDSVEVGIYANADPLQLSPTRAALDYATYAMDRDKAFRAITQGRIVKGVLSTDPVDIKLRKVTNGMVMVRPLRGARIEARLTKDGTLKGYLGGYTPVEAMYDLQFGFRDATDTQGKLSPLGRRLGSANGAARVLGHTCPGIYQALNRLADGDHDTGTGRYRSISTQYRFEARPAFIVEAGEPAASEGGAT